MDYLHLTKLAHIISQLHPIIQRLLDDANVKTYHLIDPEALKMRLKDYFIEDYCTNPQKYDGVSLGPLPEPPERIDSPDIEAMPSPDESLDNLADSPGNTPYPEVLVDEATTSPRNLQLSIADKIWNHNDSTTLLSLMICENFPNLQEQVNLIKELSDLLADWVKNMPIHMANIALLTFNDRYLELVREKRSIIEDLSKYETSKAQMINSLNAISEELLNTDTDELLLQLKEHIDQHYHYSLVELQKNLVEVNYHLNCFNTLESSELICAVCKNNPINLIANCGHTYCDQCIANLLPDNHEELSPEQMQLVPKQCAFCRAEIVQTIKLYLAS